VTFNAYVITQVGNPEVLEYLVSLGIDENIILTLILLMWRTWWAPNNASKWLMGFNSAFELLKSIWIRVG